MSVKLSSPIVFVILVVVALYFWKRYEDKKLFSVTDNPNYNMQMFQKYLLGERMLIKEELGKINKPILWIHIPYEYNSRNWQSFGSRSSFDLNQPYLFLTLKSIIDHCQDSFQIILVDDASFGKILENFNFNGKGLTCMQRQISMLSLVEKYGGMIVPVSFVCFRDLWPLFEEKTEKNKPFVAEKANHQANLSPSRGTIPDVCFLGTRIREDPEISELIHFMKKTEKSDQFTLASKFEGTLPRYLENRVARGNMNLVSAEDVGTKTAKGKLVLIEDLLSFECMQFKPRSFGIWIPSREILQRTNLQWFARMSQTQILHSNLILAKYLIVANDPNTFFSSPISKFFSTFFYQREGMENNRKNDKREKKRNNNKNFEKDFEDWKGWWKTPLLPRGMYWTKPMHLGQDVPKSNFV